MYVTIYINISTILYPIWRYTPNGFPPPFPLHPMVIRMKEKLKARRDGVGGPDANVKRSGRTTYQILGTKYLLAKLQQHIEQE